jgi:hypothetical protein
MECMTDSSNVSPSSAEPSATDSIRTFALSEDWLATAVGLAFVALILAGVITPDWLPL